MPDFSSMLSAIKLTWIKRLVFKDNKFVQLAKAITGIKDFRKYIHSKPLNIPAECPIFYKEILNKWFSLYGDEPSDPIGILNEPLWHNKYIKINNKTAHIKHAKKSTTKSKNKSS